MARDIFGNIIRTDLYGNKIPKKKIKRDVIAENRRKGKAAEESYRMNAFLRGVKVERSPRGKDFIERQTDWLTGKVKRTTHVEVKSSKTAPLSKLQNKTKKKKSNYKVIRINPLIY